MESPIDLFVSAFVTFFLLIDAIGMSPVFVTLTAAGDAAYRRRTAVVAVLVASMVIFAFALGGRWLLDHMGISIHSFRMAGGALLFLIALEMVFEKRTERREERAHDVQEHAQEASDPAPDVSVFPLGIPMLAGPGVIVSVMVFMTEHPGLLAHAVVLSAVVANMVLALAIFLLAIPLLKALGDSVVGALTRILGVLLCALAIEMLVVGTKGAFNL
ncbi:MAG: MarC family protein [Pseudomonadota bacterium]